VNRLQVARRRELFIAQNDVVDVAAPDANAPVVPRGGASQRENLRDDVLEYRGAGGVELRGPVEHRGAAARGAEPRADRGGRENGGRR
jgi:hypothetical protein